MRSYQNDECLLKEIWMHEKRKFYLLIKTTSHKIIIRDKIDSIINYFVVQKKKFSFKYSVCFSEMKIFHHY